jgi:multicomponent Na+:H+ antiporter subunit G
MTLLEVLGQVLVVLGALVCAVAGLGLRRLRDVYARLAAVAKAAGLGVSLILIGVFCLEPGSINAVKLAVAVMLQLMTSAVGSLVLARAAYVTGSPMYRHEEGFDELRGSTDRSDRDDPGRPGKG